MTANGRPRPTLAPRVIRLADTTPPITTFVSETLVRVSTVAGFDTTTVTWSTNEDAQAWQIREVANASDPVTAGTLVASGGAVAAGVNQATNVTGASLSTGDAAKLLKLFAQDLAGNWSV